MSMQVLAAHPHAELRAVHRFLTLTIPAHKLLTRGVMRSGFLMEPVFPDQTEFSRLMHNHCTFSSMF